MPGSLDTKADLQNVSSRRWLNSGSKTHLRFWQTFRITCLFPICSLAQLLLPPSLSVFFSSAAYIRQHMVLRQMFMVCLQVHVFLFLGQENTPDIGQPRFFGFWNPNILLFHDLFKVLKMRLLHYFILWISMKGQIIIDLLVGWESSRTKNLLDILWLSYPLCLDIGSPSFSEMLAPPLPKVMAFVHAYFYFGYYWNTPTANTFLDPELQN